MSEKKKKSAELELPVMSPQGLKRWRKALKMSQKEAAAALGLKRRIFQYYEKGVRNGDRIAVPKTVRLACFALAQGCLDYEGPRPEDAGDSKPANGHDPSEIRAGKKVEADTAAK